MQFSKGIGFKFDNFKPQPIFELIQKVASETGAPITDEEMLKTFNMGWGFAVIVNEGDKDAVLDSFEKNSVKAEYIGKATDSERIVASYKGKKIMLK
jgi:phosphoribosylformylglycinamidine cyclo-ligase